MAWKKEEKTIKPEELTARLETNWESSYPNSLERWTKDLEAVGYKLVSEYDLGDKKTLYRFENAGLFHNVVIEST